MNDHTITSEARGKARVPLRKARGIVALMMYSAKEAGGAEVSAAAEAVVQRLDETRDLIGGA